MYLLLGDCSIRVGRSPRWFGTLLVGIILAVAGVPSSRLVAAELSLPTVVASPSTSVAASVEYRAQGAAVAALQFDLEYDQNVLSITATIGSAAAAAGKGLTTAVLPNGNLRFLIFGLNQNVIPDGSVANLTIRVSTNASVGSYTLDFFNASGAAPSGETVPIEVHSGGVTVVATFSSTLADISNMLALGLIDNVGIANSLSQKIQNAEDAAARRQTKAAKNILGAFQNEVHAQFTAMVAQVLLQDADSLLSQLQ